MTPRTKRIALAVALVAGGALAVPVLAQTLHNPAGNPLLQLVSGDGNGAWTRYGDDEHGERGEREGHHRGGYDDDEQGCSFGEGSEHNGAKVCDISEQGGAMQGATPPDGTLFGPGGTPKAQVN